MAESTGGEPREEKWEALKAAVQRAGFEVEDDGFTIVFSRVVGSMSERASFVPGRQSARLTAYQAACEWLRQRGFGV